MGNLCNSLWRSIMKKDKFFEIKMKRADKKLISTKYTGDIKKRPQRRFVVEKINKQDTHT